MRQLVNELIILDIFSQTLGTTLLGPSGPDVVQAVAYLRRKSIALEDLKPLETTPLPAAQAEGEEESV